MKYTICMGNIIDGFEFHGVFDSHDIALDYAENNNIQETWVIVSIHSTE